MDELKIGVIMLLLVLAVFMVAIVTVTSRTRAQHDKTFLVVADHPEEVVIKIYGERFICKIYDYKIKKFTNKIIIIKESDTIPLQLEAIRFSSL